VTIRVATSMDGDELADHDELDDHNEVRIGDLGNFKFKMIFETTIQKD